MQEKERAVDVDDDSASLLSVDLPNGITMTNLCTVAISGNGISSWGDLISDLRWEDVPNRTILVKNTERLAVNLDNTGNSSSTEKNRLVH